MDRSGHRRAPSPPRRITRLHLGTTGGVLTLRWRGGGWGPLHAGLLGETVSAIAPAPGQTDTVFATSGATIYTSPDGGSRWRPLGGVAADAQVCSLLVEPRPHARILAGLRPAGIAYSENGRSPWTIASLPALAADAVTHIMPAPGEAGHFYALAGDALLSSRDNARTWEVLAELRAPIATLAVHPEAPATLYAGGPTGLFRTRNGGRSWQRLTLQPVTALLVHPNRPRTLLAALPTGLALSPNTGITWHPIAGGQAAPGRQCIGLFGHAPGEVILGVTADGGLLQITGSRCAPLEIGPTPPVLALALVSSEPARWPSAPKRSVSRRRRPASREGAAEGKPAVAPAAPSNA